MNKKKGLLLVALFCLIISPYNVTAATHEKNESANSKTIYDTNGKVFSKPEQNKVCKNYLGIKVSATPYSRAIGVDENTINPRIITVKNNDKKAYRVKVYTGNIDDLDDVEDLKDKDDLERGNISVTTYRIDGKDEINGNDSNYPKLKVQPGKEVLVVVLSGKDTSDDKETDKEYCTTSSCSKRTKLKCMAGKIADGTTSEDLKLSGNGAALLIQNPKYTSLITNVNNATKYNKDSDQGLGEACYKAREGIYNSESNKSGKYDVKQENKADWQNNYYNVILGDYCNVNAVAFTIPNSKIKRISNSLLRIYKKHLDFSSSSSVQKVSDLDKKIEGIKEEMKKLYAERGETNIDKYIYKDASKLSVALDCNYKNQENTAGISKKFYEIKENIYLYIDEGKSIKASITKNIRGKKQNVDVCSYECYEKLTVRYDPPQAVRAGMCVTAKLTVESQTECAAEDKSSAIIPQIYKPDMCAPAPICENDKDKVQAGPNEKFDKCVNECDGGKYSQSCINKCYNKVYKKAVKKKVANTKTYGDVAKVTKLNNTKSSVPVTKVKNDINDCVEKGNCDFDEEQMKKYYKNDELKKIKYSGGKIDCTNDKLIEYVKKNGKKISVCARFFYTAKAFYPKGTYVKAENNMLDWDPAGGITNAGAKAKPDELGKKNVPMQIGRAAPFYTRSYGATKDLIISMLKEEGTRRRIYNITGKGSKSSPGVKRQVRSNFVCKEECHFTGCSTEKNAMNANEYTDSIIADLEEIENKMTECSAKAACGKKEKTSTFNIEVDGKVKTGKDDKEEEKITNSSSGETKIGTTNANTSNCAMFVKENEDDGDSKNGILGKCYDNTTNKPQYKTTIVYPHSWVNYKAKTTAYENPCKAPSEKCDEVKCKKDLTLGRTSCYFENKDPSCEFEYFGSQYCVRFDSKDINTKWGDWVYKYDSKDSKKYLNTADYPNDFTPDWNINGEAKEFGEYKWHVTFRCFYAVTSNTTTPPEETTKESVCDCEKDKSCCAKVTNYSFKVLDVEKPFYKGSSSTNSNTSDKYKTLGYNFRSEATIAGIDIKNSNANAKTYAINPKKYLTKVLDSSEGKDVYKSTSYDYHIILKKDDLKQIKRDNKKSTYTSFSDGEWRDYTGIKGFKSYWSNFVTKYDKGSKRQQIKGKNNDYNNVDELLGEGE